MPKGETCTTKQSNGNKIDNQILLEEMTGGESETNVHYCNYIC